MSKLVGWSDIISRRRRHGYIKLKCVKSISQMLITAHNVKIASDSERGALDIVIPTNHLFVSVHVRVILDHSDHFHLVYSVRVGTVKVSYSSGLIRKKRIIELRKEFHKVLDDLCSSLYVIKTNARRLK